MVLNLMSGKGAALTHSSVSPKIADQKVSTIGTDSSRLQPVDSVDVEMPSLFKLGYFGLMAYQPLLVI